VSRRLLVLAAVGAALGVVFYTASSYVRGYPVLSPAKLRAWYGLRPAQDGAGQTIVITEPFARAVRLDDAVNYFSWWYELPRVCGARGVGSRCFSLVVARRGHRTNRLRTHDDETYLDVEWAHAVAPEAKIVVLDVSPVAAAIPRLDWNRAHVISASWAGSVPYDLVARSCHRAHLVCTFPSGDGGQPGVPPSNSQDVLAVGGSVFRFRSDGSIESEARWPQGGFGETITPVARPPWQRGARCAGIGLIPAQPCSYRAIPGVTAEAGGVFVYMTRPHQRGRWRFTGGTSLSSPLWAALIALADQELSRVNQPAIGIDELHRVLYRGWVSAGLDGMGHRGWNARTGWGSPKAGIVDVLVRAIERYRAGH
jgi:subtilase family serine protease